ncbi:glycoside hydrolase family 36 protein [Aquimarina sp. 2201CG5-10]|uniref:glycoside hydrolase family 36 protein n=1 Tax=Aquimarina callyspongiae TaxID=3098150 RepID=UPI002AB4124E|nr:glycoside hydrolase family 36 protein [Aquimarina sp. 2201CG5-10]MDY8134180.1 glycoside hydrolase family 36 protein [Aquimarina sp. 2201CG5-10]
MKRLAKKHSKEKALFLFMFCVFLTINAQSFKKTFSLAENTIDFTYPTQEYNIIIDIKEISNDLQIAKITLKSDESFVPKNISLKWAIPSTNIAGYWSTRAFMNKTITPDWGPAKVKSMLARHSPVISLFGYNDINRQTFAVSEALSTVTSSTAVREENGMIYNEIKLFTEKHKEVTQYSFQLRLDTRSINYATALKEVNSWWESFEIYKPALVPEVAKLPVYSTWYSYHQNVSSESILKECRQAKAMGYETVIVDDGWQTLDSNRGYAYTGDWKPERIPELKELVQKVHDLGMKFILWYAVPFAGEKSKAYEQMKGKFLTYWNGQGTYVLDPRYPEVREFIINTYIKAVKDWDLDGFKLDFIGRFRAEKDTELTAENGRDYASVNEATDKLMTDLMTSLREVKLDILVEFRQPYTGPLMKKYGNMLRASDCPNVAVINRVETTDLRLISGKTAVHADMLMWHYDEPVETAALQFLNVLFSVPQVSVRLGDVPKEHFKMIQFYTNYWLENRDVLLEGQFYPHNPQQNYPLIEGENSQKKITAVYDDRIVNFDMNTGIKQDIVNAKLTTRIVIDVKGESKKYSYTIYDCLGNLKKTKEIQLNKGVTSFEVPPSGIIKFNKL